MDLVEMIFDIFSPPEALEFIESNEVARPLTIRTNTLKAKRRDLARLLMQKGVHLEPIGSWTKVGLTIFNSNVPIGATTEYLTGYYMLQAASSLLPIMALDPQPDEKILDMSAAPGGKTTYIAQLMKNTGTIIANDSNKERCKALIANLQRLGVSNTIVVNYDGRKLPKAMNNFDRVLIDAPCSGTGVISKDPSVKTERTAKDILRNSHLQKELILAAIDSLNPHTTKAAIIVYSTCSISLEENEGVIEYALAHRYVKLIDTDVDVGNEGLTSFKGKHFDASMKLCKRIYPHTHNMDGFFFAKLQKIANGVKLLPSEAKDKAYQEKKERKREKEVKARESEKKDKHKAKRAKPDKPEEVEGKESVQKINKKKTGKKGKKEEKYRKDKAEKKEAKEEERKSKRDKKDKKNKKKKNAEVSLEKQDGGNETGKS